MQPPPPKKKTEEMLSSHLLIAARNGRFTREFLTKILYGLLLSPSKLTLAPTRTGGSPVQLSERRRVLTEVNRAAGHGTPELAPV